MVQRSETDFNWISITDFCISFKIKNALYQISMFTEYLSLSISLILYYDKLKYMYAFQFNV